MADMKSIAANEGISISQLFREFIAEHLIEKGWKPSPEELREIYRRPPLRVITPGMVYVIKCGTSYKIGRTRNLAQRLGQMSLPNKPRIVRTHNCADPGSLELRLHEMFDHRRLHGEWFELTDADVMTIKRFMAGL